MQKIPLTKQGAEKLRAELQLLKTHDRPKVVAAIAEARAHGDLKENAEYHAAKEQQGFIEARIRDIEGKLASAQIIDVTQLQNNGRVVFGATVNLVNLDDNSQVSYQIVGQDEADIKHGKIFVGSPLAKALVGKEIDDVVEVQTPAALIEYEIVKVEYK